MKSSTLPKTETQADLGFQITLTKILYQASLQLARLGHGSLTIIIRKGQVMQSFINTQTPLTLSQQSALTHLK